MQAPLGDAAFGGTERWERWSVMATPVSTVLTFHFTIPGPPSLTKRVPGPDEEKV